MGLRNTILAELPVAFAGHDISMLDRVRVAFDNGWMLARASVTEPMITVCFEGHSETHLNKIKTEVARRVPTLGCLLAQLPLSKDHAGCQDDIGVRGKFPGADYRLG